MTINLLKEKEQVNLAVGILTGNQVEESNAHWTLINISSPLSKFNSLKSCLNKLAKQGIIEHYVDREGKERPNMFWVSKEIDNSAIALYRSNPVIRKQVDDLCW